MKRLLFTVTLLAAVGLCLTTVARAAGKGANPNGKPFVELQGQIIEVEGEVASLHDQMDSIVAKVETLEDRVGANEQAIADLTAASMTLQVQIDANADDITSLEADIAALQAQNDDLQAQIEANSGNIDDLRGQIAYNQGLIAALQQSISDLGTSLQDQIDNNDLLIQSLQSEIVLIQGLLALKQALITQSCSEGYAIREVLEDGTVVCEDVSGSGAATLQTHLASAWESIHHGQCESVRARCPDGWTVTGGGFSIHPYLALYGSHPDGQYWSAGACNFSGYHRLEIFVYAQCIQPQ